MNRLEVSGFSGRKLHCNRGTGRHRAAYSNASVTHYP